MYKFQKLDVSRIERNHQLAVSFKMEVYIIVGDFSAINDRIKVPINSLTSFIAAGSAKYAIDQSAGRNDRGSAEYPRIIALHQLTYFANSLA
jgi:hypothetical protein